MNLLTITRDALDSHGVPFAVIGATALAAHGVTRTTGDLDLLVTDRRCLETASWTSVEAAGATVEVRRADSDDPLAGVIRITRGDEVPVDVIVGRGAWQSAILARAAHIPILDVDLPIVRAADLMLLKLFAGGPQDAWDIDQLLDVVPAAVPEVEASLAALPADCRSLWRKILEAR